MATSQYQSVMTPQNQYQSVAPVAPLQTPILNQPVQTPAAPTAPYPVGSAANGGTLMSDGSINFVSQINNGGSSSGQVQGVETFNPYYGSNATPSQSYSIPYVVGPTPQQQQMAAERQALIDQQQQQGLQFADQSYNDQITNLGNQEGQIKTSATSGKDYINQLRNSNVSDLTNQGDLSKRQARQSYQDQILQTRIRARALGGAASSGFMDLTGRLDQALASNLTGIDTTNMSAMSKVKITADKALTDLQAEMDKNINEIANQKNLSLRERDKAKASIQMEAAQAALEIKSWLDGKTQTLTKTVKVGGTPNTIPSIAEQAQMYKSGLLSQFGQDMSGIQGSNISSTVQKYTPAFVSAGIDPAKMQGYYTPEAKPNNPSQDRSNEDYLKYLLSIGDTKGYEDYYKSIYE
jgi:hypothetical protein